MADAPFEQDQAEPARPIFFAWTRSFWFGLLPAIALTINVVVSLASESALHGPLVNLLLTLFPSWDVVLIESALQIAAPLTAIIVAQQRAHAARPYTLRLSRETLS
jgi:hypothetical protein